MNHKVQTAIKATSVAVILAVVSGCAASNSRLDMLEEKVGMMEQQHAALESSAASAAAAQRTAESAQAAADAALKAANDSQSCCDATNEKIDRMFQKGMSK